MSAWIHARVDHADAVRWLSRALGAERAHEVWAAACALATVLVGESYAHKDVTAVLGLLGDVPGEVATAARFTLARLGPEIVAAEQPPLPASGERLSPLARRTMTTPGLGAVTTLSVDDLAAFFAPVLSADAARASLRDYARVLGLDPSALSRIGAARVLDAASGASGVLGTLASFAKAQFHLRYPAA